MFDFLAGKFSSIFSQLSGNSTLTEKNIEQTIKDVQQALIEADVPYNLVQSFTDSVQKEVVGQKVIGTLKPKEQFIKIVHTKLVDFLGGSHTGEAAAFSFQLPSVIMVMGLQGSGKTTTVAKMAYYTKQQAVKRGKKRHILLASVDFYRPAAVEQLKILANQVGVSFFQSSSQDPLKAAVDIFNYYKKEQFELLFLDTAGRLHVDNALLEELQKIEMELNPRYKILVLDAMTGQESLNIARAFDQAVGFDSVVLTKMDSDARAGAAFSFRYALKKPILFAGIGEKIEDLNQFYAERAANRILGMGDLQTLMEKADEKIKQTDQDGMARALMQGKLTLQDFADQIDMIHKLGSFSQLSKYLPGMGGQQISSDMMQKGEIELKKFRAIIGSMTTKERVNPVLLSDSRKQRIAKGSGTKPADIDILLQRFEQAQQYVKLFKKSGFLKNLFK